MKEKNDRVNRYVINSLPNFLEKINPESDLAWLTQGQAKSGGKC
jgi:hypothetical protein